MCSAIRVKLVDALATSRARMAEPQNRRRGDRLTEEGIRYLAVEHQEKTFSRGSQGPMLITPW